MNIYIDGLGFRNADTECTQIIWYLNAVRKSFTKRRYTILLLDIHNKYVKDLRDSNCFKLLHYISLNLSGKQLKSHMEWKRKQSLKNEIDLINFESYVAINKKRKLLLQSFSSN